MHDLRHKALLAAVTEALESRRLLAAIEAGVLVARGTDGNDSIAVQRSGADNVLVTTNGVSQSFDMNDFTGVRLQGLGGDDRFNLIDPLVSPVVRNTTVLGGGGSDTISYATRTTSLDVDIDPAGSTITSGAQLDAFDEVETVVGGLGADVIGYGNDAEIPFEDEDADFAFRLEGGGGGDRFVDGLTTGHNFGFVTLVGGAGNDSFDNDEFGAEFFFGGDGDDEIFNNNFAYNAGRLDGGAGIDFIRFDRRDSEVFDLNDFAGIENATMLTGSTLIGTDAPNLLTAVNGGTLRGGDGNDTLLGAGFDQEVVALFGEGGDDSLVGDERDDTVDGGAGTDIGDGGPGNNIYVDVEIRPAAPNVRIDNRTLIADGSWGRDQVIVQRSGDDQVTVNANGTVTESFAIADFDGILLRGNNGYDELSAFDAIPDRPLTLIGGAGNDSLMGSEGNDVLLGGDRDDELQGMGGNDSLVGAFGHDALDGGSGGADTVDGGPGNDIIRDAEITPPPPTIGIVNGTLIADGSWGVDLLTIERVGSDKVIVRVNETSREFDVEAFDGVLLRGNGGFDYLTVLDPVIAGSLSRKVTLEGGNGNDTLFGAAGEDVLRGGTGNDVLRGFGGNDALFGNGGADLLEAGNGNDFLDGTDGDPFDTLFGGDGTDSALIDSGDRFSGVETVT